MNTLELLYEAKRKMGVSSDYALAQILEIRKQRMTDYKSGRLLPDTYVLTRLAIILERDPMSLIAEFEAETEKDPVRKEFWKGFLSRQNLKGIAIAVLALSCGLFYDHGAMADTSKGERTYNGGFYKTLILKTFALWITFGILAPILSSSNAIASTSKDTSESRVVIDVKAHYAKLIIGLLMRLARLKMLIFERYFTCNWHVKFSLR